MPRKNRTNYEILDQPQVLNFLFHPRPQIDARPSHTGRQDMMIPVDDTVSIGASLHVAGAAAPTILFFHGNGEIVSDYDELGRLFTRIGVNFFVVDYRGYGSSTGHPTVAAMMQDCHMIGDYVENCLKAQSMTGPLCVMGRSLGSASAIELAVGRQNRFACLIVESGFAWAGPLLKILGIDADRIGFKEEQGFENVDKIKRFTKPCLVIHAQYDHIIPLSDGRSLFEACGADKKKLLEIEGANHNDIFLRGMDIYLSHVREICFSGISPP